MKPKKHKRLYRYFHKKLAKHVFNKDCDIELEIRYPHGELWRCRHGAVDFFGFFTIKEAKAEEVQQTKERIQEEKEWLKKLEGK